MKKGILYILIPILFFSFCLKASAQEICSQKGYSIFSINGIFNDEIDAIKNKDKLKSKFSTTYNNEPLIIDYLYNPTHLAGVGDLADVIAQGLFNQKSDYDLVEMLNDASQKVTTQKILLVAHSQGNFYANNFYDKTASKPGGVPSQSIGVYSVATPANRVAGGGKYLTSDTDNVIAAVVADFIKILSPNIHIPLKNSDGNGHSFSDVYLKYQGNRIISDIKSSLSKLENNDEQESGYPCISPPELSALHKIQGVILAVADPTAIVVKGGVIGAYNIGAYIADGVRNAGMAIGDILRGTGAVIGKTFKGLSANVIETLPDVADITTIPPDLSKPVKDSPSEIADEPAISLPEIETLPPEDSPVIPDVSSTAPHNRGGSGSGGGGEDENLPDPIADTASPVIILTGSNPLDIYLGMNYADPGATATDDVDATVAVVITGNVDTSVIGTYTITYTATDLSGNIATAIRTVNVLAPIPDTTAPVITLLGNSVEVVIRNSTYTDAGATALDNVDGVLTVITTGAVDTAKIGNYIITYAATDLAGNTSTATRTIIVATYKYIPKYSFGENNGDNHDWQVWSFNGSNVYDWSDTYVHNYLREQFKIQANAGTAWCSQCLQRGIFKHDPQKGFESSDVAVSALENNPQNYMNGITYDVAIQWDSSGYTYTVSHDSIIDSSKHTQVANMNNDFWVGWDGSFNNFKNFPSGDWQGIVSVSPLNRTGGGSMVLQPFPIYKNEPALAVSTLSFPNQGPYTVGGISPTRGRENLTPFTFQIIYTDEENNPPQNVKLQVTDATTGDSVAEVEMRQISQGVDIFSDGDFANGESYTTDDILYDTGDYNYYFTTEDNAGDSMRIPQNDALKFGVVPSAYKYIPKYSFGMNNGDDRDWQVWSFNGSNVYDWTDTYVNDYLREQFKIQTFKGGAWCSQCLQRGIFKHDPQKGFELSDRIVSILENNPQNSMNGLTYEVTIQWDSAGYSYSISHDGTTDSSGHTDIADVNENMWVGWDGSFNNFKIFPSGDWQGVVHGSPSDRTGGSSMVLQPYPIYDSSQVPPDPVLSSAKQISAFNFTGLTPEVVGVINETDHTILLEVSFGTDVANLNPTITISSGASISPNFDVPQDFSNPINYTVKAEDDSTQDYLITVVIGPDPNPPPVPDTTAPAIASYTFNEIAGDITINPLVSPLSLAMNASENAEWVSVKFENQNDGSFYKIFYPGADCDDKNTCVQDWDGILSSGGLLQNGTFRVKVHVKDSAGNEFYDYLTPYNIIVDISI